jgi:hypothetical protein
MDSDLGSSMMLLRLLPAAAAIVPALITFTLLGPMVLYVIARWRAHRAPVVDPTGLRPAPRAEPAGAPPYDSLMRIDPQLGLKFALHWFSTTAFHLALAGATFLIYTLIGPGPSSVKGDMYRVAFALLVPAGIIYGVHAMLLRRTNDLEVPGVRRLFLGYNLIVTGLVGFVALVAGFQIMFAKASFGGAGHLAAAAVLVYCGSWAVLGMRLGQLVLGDFSGGAGGMPDELAPPGEGAPHPPAAAAGAGGRGAALPPLGGGSFPPIEPR